jgi:hypothetical protein
MCTQAHPGCAVGTALTGVAPVGTLLDCELAASHGSAKPFRNCKNLQVLVEGKEECIRRDTTDRRSRERGWGPSSASAAGLQGNSPLTEANHPAHRERGTYGQHTASVPVVNTLRYRLRSGQHTQIQRYGAGQPLNMRRPRPPRSAAVQ